MIEYRDLEDELTHSVPDIELQVKCDCGNVFEYTVDYGGVVSSDERAMGPEKMHVWKSETTCSECDEDLTVEVALWEYPMLVKNYVDFSDCYNCTVINKGDVFKKLGYIPADPSDYK